MDHVGKAKSVMTWGTLMAQRIPAGDIQPRASFASHCLPSIPFLGNGNQRGIPAKLVKCARDPLLGPTAEWSQHRVAQGIKASLSGPKGTQKRPLRAQGSASPFWNSRTESGVWAAVSGWEFW